MLPAGLNITQFAEYMEAIKRLYTVDDDFKALCDDYVTSKNKIEKLKEKTLENMRNELEYEQLSRELEKEILEYVARISY